MFKKGEIIKIDNGNQELFKVLKNISEKTLIEKLNDAHTTEGSMSYENSGMNCGGLNFKLGVILVKSKYLERIEYTGKISVGEEYTFVKNYKSDVEKRLLDETKYFRNLKTQKEISSLEEEISDIQDVILSLKEDLI